MEQTNQNTPQNNQQAQQPQFKCQGNCLKCLPAQRQYCASQHAYSNMMVLDRVMETLVKMQERMEAMQGSVAELAEKIENIRSGEDTVFDPGTVAEADLFFKEPAKKESDK